MATADEIDRIHRCLAPALRCMARVTRRKVRRDGESVDVVMRCECPLVARADKWHCSECADHQPVENDAILALVDKHLPVTGAESKAERAARVKAALDVVRQKQWGQS